MTTQTGDATTHTNAPNSTHSVASPDPAPFDLHKQGGFRRLIISIARLADIQGRLWLTEVKLTVLKIALYTALFGAASLIAILGIIFLFIGLFHVLTDLLHIPPVYAFLIFGIAQLLLAYLIVFAAKKQLSKRNRPKPRPAI